MTETSRFWGGTTTGDAVSAPYDAEIEFAAVLNSLSTGASVASKGGVFRAELNALAVSAGAGQVSVNTGSGIVDGTWYNNSASVNVAIPTPAGATRVDYIVLRKDFAAKTVRITRIAGTEGAGTPALVQIAGTTWDVPLATASIDTGGTITVTDDRDLLPVQEAAASTTEDSRGVWVRVKGTTEARTAGESAIDDELQVPIVANQQYFFSGVLYFIEAAVDLDVNLGVAGPNGAGDEVFCAFMGRDIDGVTFKDVVTTSINLVVADPFDTTNKAVMFTGSYRSGASGAGTLGIQWAPAVVSGNAVSLVEGSTLQVVRKIP